MRECGAPGLRDYFLTDVYLVRHGQASYGSDDYDQLSALGRQQSRWLGEYFAARGVEFDSVLYGAMQRHRDTASGICDGMGRRPDDSRVHRGLDEFDFQGVIGTFLADNPDFPMPENPPPEEFPRILRPALTEWSRGRLDGRVAEDWRDFEARGAAVLDDLGKEPADARILVVSSSGAMSMILKHVLKCDEAAMVELNLQMRNTGFSHILRGRGPFRLHSFNAVPHLDGPGREDALTFL